jgi:glyoxylase-like metal-dependent hydrolase (beta-lactamase superfamily II)
MSAPPAPPPQPAAWTEPGAFEVAPGVYRIPLPMPNDGLAAVNVFAIDDGKGLTLIDGGWAVEAARKALELGLQQLGATTRSITRILVTHSHRDHYTLAVQLRRELGIPIALGIGEKPNLETIIAGMSNFTPQLPLLREAGAFELADFMEKRDRPMNVADGWELPDQWLEAGEAEVGQRRLTILATPGHTRGHVVFADQENQLLFAGDHVLPHITPSLGLEAALTSSPLREFLSSLAAVRALPDLKLLGAHGPSGASSHQRVDELVLHHDQRLAEMLAVVAAATPEIGVTSMAVAGSVGWTRRKRALADLDPFNKMLAILETTAHLRVLTETGAIVRRRDPAGVALYAAAPAQRTA